MCNNSMLDRNQKYIYALVKNDRALLNELYQKFRPIIKRMVLKNRGTETDADDIFQDALLSIYCRAKAGNLIVKEFDSFLYTVCRNKWLDKLNNERKISKETKKDIYSYSGTSNFEAIEEAALHQQRLELLTEKFAELGERCKELLHLSWSGKSLTEVASRLNVSYSYCRKNKSESIKRLKKLMIQSSKFALLKG